MRIALFYHSLVSDWNHGNAHFLRGIATELLARGHEIEVLEPEDAWSVQNLVASYGEAPLAEFRQAYPHLSSTRYNLSQLDLNEKLDNVDLVLVHEWNDPALIGRIAEHRKRHRCRILFHDTHHRSISDSGQIFDPALELFDGVLAFGESVSERYRRLGWGLRVWTWHEAADVRVFHPLPSKGAVDGDLVWVGNWGDDERTRELNEFLFEPVTELGLKAKIFGVRYPESALRQLNQIGIEYRGWTPNYRVPRIFSRFKATVHIPRRPYSAMLRGVPTIRVFEALACGIPLISGPWDDSEGLFRPGQDFLMASSGAEVKTHLRALLSDEDMAREVAAHGVATITRRHTCRHRVDELMNICQQLGMRAADNAYHPKPPSMDIPAGAHGEV